jgi:hypothetical protein
MPLQPMPGIMTSRQYHAGLPDGRSQNCHWTPDLRAYSFIMSKEAITQMSRNDPIWAMACFYLMIK